MTNKLGIGTYAFAWSIGVPGYAPPAQAMDHRAFLQLTADMGLGVAQIADNLPLHRLTDDDRAALKQFADGLSVAVEVGTRGIQPDHLQHYLVIAAQFESPILRVVVDSAGHHPDPPEIIDILRGILPELEQRNITLAIENHDRFRAAQLVEILEAVASPHIGICLDTVNSFGALEGPRVVVEQLGRYVVNLHVKDFLIARLDHNMGFLLEGTPAGSGMLDVPWLLEQLNQHGHGYNAIIELWLLPDDDLETTIAREQAWARQSVQLMRQWIEE